MCLPCYTGGVALGSQLPIRLDAETDARLQALAEKLDTSKSALIRLLAKTFCEHVVQADGSVLMPPNWEALLPRADARSKAGTSRDVKRAEKMVDDAVSADARIRKPRRHRPKKRK